MLYKNKPSKTNYNVSKTNYLLQFFRLVLAVFILTLLLYIFINLVLGILVKGIDPERGMLLRERITSFSDDLAGTDKQLTEHASRLWQPFSEHDAFPLVKMFGLGEEEESQNAFVLPGGFIFITKSSLVRMNSENELSFVLCHELGHIVKRHIQKRLGTNLIFLIFSILTVNDSSLVLLIDRTVNLHFSRQDEYEADEFALTCLDTYYGHTNGATHFFERLKNLEHYKNEKTELMSTHPDIDNRISRILDLVKQKGFKSDLPLKPLTITPDD